jgi:hypothetical protein
MNSYLLTKFIKNAINGDDEYAIVFLAVVYSDDVKNSDSTRTLDF